MDYDEINLRPYLAAIGRRWHWIVIGAVLAAAVAVGVSYYLPREYQATANVLAVIRESNIGVGGTGPLANIETIDAQARRQGLVALAQSDAIEARLPQTLLTQLEIKDYRPGMLLQSNRIVAYANGDLIGILAKGPTAEEAQLLANSWANSFASYTRELYDDELTKVAVASEALLPLQPAGSGIVRNVVLGALLGALLGLGMAMLAAVVKLPRFGRVSTPKQTSPRQPTPTR